MTESKPVHHALPVGVAAAQVPAPNPDEAYWVRIRVDVISALESEGLQIVSDKHGARLRRLHPNALAEAEALALDAEAKALRYKSLRDRPQGSMFDVAVQRSTGVWESLSGDALDAELDAAATPEARQNGNEVSP